jgi:hypothetical protein
MRGATSYTDHDGMSDDSGWTPDSSIPLTDVERRQVDIVTDRFAGCRHSRALRPKDLATICG